MKIFTFTVYGDPKGKGRPRFTRNGKTYTLKETKEYEELVKWSFKEEYSSIKPYFKEVPLEVVIDAYFRKPKSAKREYPTVRPDCDNIAKSICDALNGVAYYDDAQIVRLHITKNYTDSDPYVLVTISAMSEEKSEE